MFKIHYVPGAHIHKLLNKERMTRSLPAPTRPTMGYCSINDVYKVDCHPEKHSSETSCVSRGCCWKPSPNKEVNVPYCYFPDKHKKFKSQACPILNNEQKLDCHPEPGALESRCLNRDCCWEPVNNNKFDVPYCYYKNMTALPLPPQVDPASCSNFRDVERIDCYPENGASKTGCQNRGCCWATPLVQSTLNVPYCFYPRGYGGYTILNISETSYGLEAYLNRTFRSAYPKDIAVIKMIVKFEDESRIHIKILDAENTRWEPPYPEIPLVDNKKANPAYSFIMDRFKSGFKVIRKSDNSVM